MDKNFEKKSEKSESQFSWTKSPGKKLKKLESELFDHKTCLEVGKKLESQFSWKKNPEKKLLKTSRATAARRGLIHTLSLEDIVIPEYCPYLKIKLTSTIQQCNTASTMSLDRIDSSKGYIKGNVQVISRLANLMKSFASEDELRQFAKSVLEIHGDK